MADLSTRFTGIPFVNPFLLASAPPTESESNIERAFDAGWGGVVTKTIGLHPVVNVAGPKTKFFRTDPATSRTSMAKRPDATLMASWNWELISDKPLDWWLPRIERIKRNWPDRVLVASIMAGSGDDKEFDHWQTLTAACRGPASTPSSSTSLPAHGPHRHGRQRGQGPAPVLRLHPGGQGGRHGAGVGEADPRHGEHRGRGPRNVPWRRRRHRLVQHVPGPALGGPRPLEFEINVDGLVSAGGMGGPAILPLSLAKMSELTKEFPDREFTASAASRAGRRRSTTSCWAAGRSRWPRPPCSTTPSGPTSSAT